MSQSFFDLLVDGAAASIESAPRGGADGNVAAFVQENLPLARGVASRIGVDPQVLLGQWGLETGWGRSVIPGTNNLGNIKDFSGAGPQATDNQNGSRDSYRQYASADEFGQDFAGLIGRRYKTAMGAGADADRFFSELKRGGYAEDADYVRKGVAATDMVRRAMGGDKSTRPYVEPRNTDFVGELPPIPERSVGEALADAGIGFASGVVDGVGMVAGVAGADNALSKGAREMSEGMRSAQSPARQAQRRVRAEIIAAADDSGSTWEEIKAYAGALAEAPGETILNAVGTSAPTLLVSLIPGLNTATAARLVVQGAIGASQGAGAVKGSIYEAVERKLIEDGVSPSEAAKVASAAQAYEGPNKDQILIGLGLGTLAATTGAEKALGSIVGRKAGAEAAERGVMARTAGGMAAEAPVEAAQGGQERVASNIALQNEGYDVPTFQGAAGQATLEGLASAPLGGVAGALNTGRPPAAAPAVPPALADVAAKAAEPNSPLSKAALSGAAAQQAVAPAPAAPQVDPLTQRARAVQDQARSSGLLDAMRAEGSPVDAKKFLDDLAVASSESTPAHQREQALTRLEFAAGWAESNAPARPAAMPDEIGGTVGGERPQGAAPTLDQKRTAADRDAQMQAQLAAATTEFERQQIRAQMATNLEQRLRAPGEPAAAPAPAEPNDAAQNQARLEAAALAGKDANRRAEDEPRQIVIDRALRNVEERGGVASPQEAQIFAEAGIGRPYDRIDESLAPAPELVLPRMAEPAQPQGLVVEGRSGGRDPNRLERTRSSVEMTETDPFTLRRDTEPGAAPAPADFDQVTPSVDDRFDTSDLSLQPVPSETDEANDASMRAQAERRERERADRDAALQQQIADSGKAAPVDVDAVIAALKPAPFQRTADQKATLDRATRTLTSDQMRVLRDAAKQPAALSATDRLQLQQMRDVKRSAERSEQAGTTGGAASPASQENVSRETVDSRVPAYLRKRRATLDQLVDNGFDTVGRDGDAWVLRNSRTGQTFRLDGGADAQLARASLSRQIDRLAHEAASSPKNDLKAPTEAQIEAENYKKGHLNFQGLDISVENPRGSTRSGTAPDGTKWQTTMAHHYGYVKRTEGADGDAVDVFIGPRVDSQRVFVIDQKNQDGSFDEHKAMLGFLSEEAARAGYLANYDEGWTGLGAVTEMSVEEFRAWLKTPAAKEPAAQRPDVAELVTAAVAPGTTFTVTDDGQQVALVRVDPEQLPTTTDSAAREGRRHQLTQDELRALDVLAALFGKNVQVFSDPERRLGDGFVRPDDVNSIYINELTSISPLAIFGHELMHLLRAQHPQIYAAIAKVVSERVSNAQGFRVDYYGAEAAAERGDAPLNSDELEELIADLNGNLMRDASFWRDVLDQVAADNSAAESRGIIARLAAFVGYWLDRAVDLFKGQRGFSAGRFVTDAKAIRTALRDAMAAYVKDAGLSQPAMAGEVLKAKKSTERDMDAFRKNLLDKVKAQREYAELLSRQHDWAFNVGDTLLSTQTGKTYRITGRSFTKTGERISKGNPGKLVPTYAYESGNPPPAGATQAEQDAHTANWERGMFREDRLLESKTMKNLTTERPMKFSRERGAEQDMPGHPPSVPGKAISSWHTSEQWEEAYERWHKIRALLSNRHPGVKAEIGVGSRHGLSGVVVLERVESAERGLGAGTAFMRDLVTYADREGVTLSLLIADHPSNATSAAQLRRWYGEFGFRPHDDVRMRRQPGTAISRGAAPGSASDGVTKSVARYTGAPTENAPRDNAQPSADRSAGDRAAGQAAGEGGGRAGAERPDALRGGDAGGLDGADRAERRSPGYGQAQPGSSSAVGVHYSTQPRERLNAAYYGRGLKGAERARLDGRENADIRPRIFFYVDKGQGVRPEFGVGPHAHEVRLENLYDVTNDPLGIVAGTRGAEGNRSNAWERAVMEAGFDGYLHLDPAMPQGFAVLLGGKHTNVPVSPTSPTNVAPPAAAEPETTKKGLLSKEANALDVSRIPGAKLRMGTLEVPAASRDAANEELERIGSAVRFSRERLETPAEQYAAVEKKLKGTDAWMKAPNGEPSKLTERQWVHVRTPSFKKWFGDWEAFAGQEGGVWADDKGEVSKVVGENGEPLVVYHGTSSGGFAKFEDASGGKRGSLGVFLTDNWDMASTYARRGRKTDIDEGVLEDFEMDGEPVNGVYALFANIRLPNEAHFEGANWDGSRAGQYQVLDANGDALYADDGTAYFREEEDAQELADLHDGARVEAADDHHETTDGVTAEALREERDGAIIRDVMDDGGGMSYYAGEPADIFVAFMGAQVKSADFNIGTYDRSEDDIRFSRARRVDPFEVSTRAPSAKPNKKFTPEDPVADLLISDFRAGLQQPAWLDAVATLVEQYPNYREAKSATTPEKKLERLVRQMTDSLMWLHSEVPEGTRARSKQWYDGARAIAERMAKKYDVTEAQAAGIMAVLSPQKDWFTNISLADRVAQIVAERQSFMWSRQMDETAARIFAGEAYAEDVEAIRGQSLGELDDDSLRAMWLRIYDEAHNARGFMIVSPEGDPLAEARTAVGEPAKVAWGGISTIAKGVSIFTDGSFENINKQLGRKHKVRNFYNNILVPNSPNGHVTIDTHAVAAALLRPLSGNSLEVMHNFGGPKSAHAGLEGTYALYEEAYHRAAEQLGLLPRELQSITWEAVRGLFTPGFKSQTRNVEAINKIWTQHKKGRLSYEHARIETLEAAGGIEPPGWSGRDPGAYAEDEPAADGGDVRRDELAGPDAGAAGRRGAGGDSRAAAVQRSAERPDAGAVRDDRGVRGSDESLALDSRPEQGLRGSDLEGLPAEVRVDGQLIRFGGFKPAQDAARAYAQKAGIDYQPPTTYVKVDAERATRIATAFEAMAHDPQHPDVKAAYRALIDETSAQYQAMLDAGVTAEFIDGPDPYGNPRNAILDVTRNNHLWVFPTTDGFGGSESADVDISGNPLLEPTAFEISGRTALANDLFRAVHDYFGHIANGVGFRADGEENAWRHHAAMFTPLARRALTTETRGQNSWVNYGKFSEHNKTAGPADTQYAPQKIGLLPEWASEEGRTDDVASDAAAPAPESITKSAARAPAWYSQLERALEQVPARLSTMSAPQWAQWIKANASKHGVKQDEITWSGIEDYLKLRGKDKISADELAAWVGENGVKVEEVVLGHPNDESADGDTKFDQYTLPGGENYRELLLTLPQTPEHAVLKARLAEISEEMADTTTDRFAELHAERARLAERWGLGGASMYKSSHWGEKNVLAHIRFNERTDAEGKRVLFVEEAQSDWGQEGKKKGFAQPPMSAEELTRLSADLASLKERRRALVAADRASGAEQVNPETERVLDEEVALQSRINAAKRAASEGVPRAPFVADTKSWLSLALKRAIKWAVDNDFDRVAFTTGEQNVDRYDISKQLDTVSYGPSENAHGVVVGYKGTTAVISRNVSSDAEVADILGKEAAERLLSLSPDKYRVRWLRGQDLKVGGEGMRTFYDQIVPQVARDLVKKLGGDGLKELSVDVTSFGKRGRPADWSASDGAFAKQPGFDITPKMREQVAGGMPLFSRYRENPELTAWAEGALSGRYMKEPAHLVTRKLPHASLAMAGLDADLPVIVDVRLTKHIRTAGHAEVSPQMVGRLADLMANPRAVIRNTGADGIERHQMLVDARDRDGNPILVALRQSELTHARKSIDVYDVRTMFGREESMRYILDQLRRGNVVWMADKEIAAVRDFTSGGMLPRAGSAGAQPKGAATASSVAGDVALKRFAAGDKSWKKHTVQLDIPASALDDAKGVKFSRQRNPVTETPEFKKWFGDSKVVDKDGAPRVVYHATEAGGVDVFKRGRGDIGIHFGTAEQAEDRFNTKIDADPYGPQLRGTQHATIPVYLSIKNPLRMDDVGRWESIRWVMPALDRQLPPGPLRDSVMAASNMAGIRKALLDHGHDGIVYRNKNESLELSALKKRLYDGGYSGRPVENSEVRAAYDAMRSKLETDGDDSFIAFSPTQIKSAIGNDGGFDPTDPSITKSTARSKTLESGGQLVFSSTTEAPAATQGAVGWQAPSASKFDSAIYKLQDKHVDTKRVTEAIKEAGGAIRDDLDVYLQEELFHGRAAKRTEDFVDMELQPLVDDMAKRGLTITELDEYLHARHAREANAVIAKRNPEIQDGGSGLLNQDAEAYFAELSAAKREALEAAAAKVDAMIRGTNKLLVDYELESGETIKGWGEMFQHYVPLMREDDGRHAGNGTGQGFSIKGREVKSRTGSKRKVVDILANIAMQRERTVVRGEKNRVARALFGLAAANGNKDFWEVDTHVPTEQVFNAKTGKVENRPDNLYKQRPNVVTAKFIGGDGKLYERAVVFNEKDERAMRMAEALKNLDAAQLEGLLGASASVTRYFASVNTQYNPVFGIVNLVRDVQGALVNLQSTQLAGEQKTIARNTLPALRGIYADTRAARKGKQPSSAWAALWDDFQEVGGQTGFRQLFQTSADRAQKIEQALDPDKWTESRLGKIFTANGALKVPMAAAMRGARWIFDWLSDYNLAMENGIRLAAYKAGLDKGLSKERAASIAKNLTVNFNRKGQAAQQAGALYAFFNASAQGTARLGQVLFDMEPGKPKTIRLSALGKKVVYGGMLLGSIQALAMAAAGFNDDDPPDFVRERSLIIPIGGKKYISIPMPLGLHVIPNLGRIPTEWALSGFKDTPERAVSVVALFADAFNPIGNAGLSMQTLAPTALDPLVALTENKDWSGRPIAKESMNRAVPGHALARDTATAMSRVLSEAINYMSGGTKHTAGVISPTPDQIDYLIGQVTGGVGREISKVEQTATAAVHGETMPTYKVPLVGRFVGNSASQASEGSAFYANVNRLNELETEIKGLRKDGDQAAANELRMRNPEAYLITAANAAERRVQKLRRQKTEMVKAGAARDEVKAIEERITAEMARLNRAAEQLRERVEAD